MITKEIQERIESRINEEIIQKTIAETNFHFELGTKAVEDWQAAKSENPDFFEDLSKLDYNAIKEKALTSSEVLNTLNLMNTIVSYSDENANEKSKYNQYPDKRVVAKAGIRQNNWIKHLLIYKLDENSPAQSIKNALNYLLDPLSNVPIYSEDHKRLISEHVIGKPYNFDTFTNDLIKCFKPFNLKPNSDKNLTYIIMRLLYFIDDVWCDTVTGLIARVRSDEWKDELIEAMQVSNYGIVWWHKRPSRPQEVINEFEKKIKNDTFFYFYYVSNNKATYRARVIDLAEYANYNSKVDKWRALNPHWFSEDVNNYKDSKQSARMIFLIDQLEKLETPIPISDFVMYKEAAKPNVVNLVAYSRIKNEISQNTISSNINDNIQSNTQVMKQPLNQILYGPPGTGKTFNSIDKAVAIATPKRYSGKHSENKIIFDELRKQGQIEFVTFHQNYSYEDFVVGIRPNVNEDANTLSFKKHTGIFYNIADKARENYLSSLVPRGKLLSVQELINDLLENLRINGPITLKTPTNVSFQIEYFSELTIQLVYSNGSKNNTLSVDTLKEITEDKRDFTSSLRSYYYPVKEYLLSKRIDTKTESVERKNFVLVIDEINRANISKVFGELITLLEDDKRLGEQNDLKITLPNGEKEFGVPPNLYLIGTMNTADKSIALIDIALRRRFEFLGFYPNYDILKTEAKTLLQKINEEIYKLKNSADYLIGHAYFMKDQDIETTLRNKVVPLLMEFFSGKTKIVSDIFNDTNWKVDYDISKFEWTITLR